MTDTQKTVIKCGFAAPGTYGHDCGRPAVTYAVKKSDRTISGLYYGGRCAECAILTGGDNAGIIRFEEIKDQKNEWSH